MFRPLIDAFRAEIQEDDASGTSSTDRPEPEGESSTPKRSKHDRSSEKMGYLLSTPLAAMSRKKMMKMIPHLLHHFTKGHGKPGEDGSVDSDDLATLGRHAKHISDQANSIRRMPGAAHHLAGHLMRHVADCHDRMAKAKKMSAENEDADLHANEGAKFRALSKAHQKVARRHGIYDESY